MSNIISSDMLRLLLISSLFVFAQYFRRLRNFV